MWEVRALKNGECKVKGDLAFHDGDPDELFDFYLYVWLITSQHGVIVVDTGPKDVQLFNDMVKDYIPDGVKQLPEETTLALLRRVNVEPTDVQFVSITHTHYDHASLIDIFPNATIVLTRRTYDAGSGSLDSFSSTWRQRARIVADDEEFVPGISLFWVGGHSPCSQAMRVQTADGIAIICGDTVFLYRNIEENRPIGAAHSIDECYTAMERIRREADIVLPGHDPEVLKRYPHVNP